MNAVETPFGPASDDVSGESRALLICEAKMNEIRENHPDWYELFDETCADNAPRSEVVELLQSAPTDFSMGMMYGKFSMRLELEAVTGRAFE